MEEQEKQAEAEIEEKQTRGLSKFVYSVLLTFSIIFIIGTFFGRIVYFPIKVEGVSMQPTLNAQASGNASDTVYLASPRNISRGDIVVFDAKKYTTTKDGESYFIKRVIGLPGDTIYFSTNGTIKDGKIYYDIFVNGVRMEESYTKDPMWFNANNPRSQAEINFFVNYVETQKRIVLDRDEYYLMGDNRNNSTDSRFLGNGGKINKSDFIGKVVLQIKSNQTIFEALIQKLF